MKNIKIILSVFCGILFAATLFLSAQNLSYLNGEKSDKMNDELYGANELIEIEISGSAGEGEWCWGNPCADANGLKYNTKAAVGDGDPTCCGIEETERGQLF